MIHNVPEVDPNAPAIVIDIGNTAIHIATWHEGEVKTPLSAPTADRAAFEEIFDAHVRSLPGGGAIPVVVASVVPDALSTVQQYVQTKLDRDPLVIREKIPLPLDVGVTDPSAIGVDRVCAAAAVYDQLQAPCIVVDFGSAVTVDLVDEDGVLLGGAILPGVNMQLRALHEHTAVLPAVEAAVPELAYGRDTTEAIQTGVCRGVAGAVRGLVEGYATALGQWPQVVATGGDLELLLPHCDFIDTPVQHLTLRGVGIAYRKYLEGRAG